MTCKSTDSFGGFVYVKTLREDSQIDFVMRDVPWVLRGKGFLSRAFLCNKIINF